MFLRLNDHDYVKIGFFDNLGGETHLEKVTHRFAQDELGHIINSTICIDEQELRKNNRHCPLCSQFIKLKKQAKTREEHQKANKHKSEPLYYTLVYNYKDKKIQILHYAQSIFDSLEKLKRINGTLLGYAIGIKNNHGYDNPDKKWYVVEQLENTPPLEKIIITEDVLRSFNKIITPLSFEELETKVRGEIKIVDNYE